MCLHFAEYKHYGIRKLTFHIGLNSKNELNEAIALKGYKQYREHINNFYAIIQAKDPELWLLLFGESHENRSYDDDL